MSFPTSNIDPNSYFYTTPSCINIFHCMGNEVVNTPFRFTDKSANACAEEMYGAMWQESIQLYGQMVNYYQHPYDITQADNFYGEDPVRRFGPPQQLIMGIHLDENALRLTQFGYMSNDYITAFVSISSFYDVFGSGAEPKSGDLFKLIEYGSDRPGQRDGNLYQVTERIDQDNSQINALMGHYVWLIKAKRFDYSYEPGLDTAQELGDAQVGDDSGYGTVLDDTTQPVTTINPRTTAYPFTANAAALSAWQYGGDDSVYGGYGYNSV